MAKLLSFRVWILIFAVIFAILAINPSPWAEGIQVKSVGDGSPLAEAGLKNGELIQSVNRQEITSLAEYKEIMESITFEAVTLTITTEQGSFDHTFLGDLGIAYDENLTITAINTETRLEQGMVIQSIDGTPTTSEEDIEGILEEVVKKEKFILGTDKG